MPVGVFEQLFEQIAAGDSGAGRVEEAQGPFYLQFLGK